MSLLQKPLSKIMTICFLLTLNACVYGPKNSEQTFAEKMNGENYQSKNIVMGIPVLERKLISRKISGSVFCGQGINQTPANHASIELIKDNQVVSSASTDSTGAYLISAQVEPQFLYKLNVTSLCGKSSRDLPKDSKMALDGENFYLSK